MENATTAPNATTDTGTPARFGATMTAPEQEKHATESTKAPEGILTRPAAQVAPEIAPPVKWQGSSENLKTMEAARIKMAELRAAGLMRSPLEKFLDDPRPLRAIRRFCYECNGFSLAAATNCTSFACPLWLFRRGSGVIAADELPTWRAAYSQWMKHTGEINRVSDDVESGADEVEPLTEELEG